MPDVTQSPKSVGSIAPATPAGASTSCAPRGCGCGSKKESAPAAATTEPTTTHEPGRGPDRRKSAVDRRSGLERRQASAEASGYTGPERRSGTERRVDTGLERRRGPGRRRSDERKSAEEGEMTGEQFEFVMAIQTYKKVNKKLYPTWTEVLEVMRQLGYRKVLPREIKLENVPEPRIYNGEAA
ncbi:MAG: hypothetical protein ACAI43_19210 [Phycisphaerae bacterium]|nr:hypothetical protein [Tepidisphaeraceae bacterium]